MAVDRVTWQWLCGMPTPALCRGRLPSHWRPPLPGGSSRTATYPVADSHQARVNPRPAGPLYFPPPAGGVFEHPPSISVSAHRRTKRINGVRKLAKNHFEIISVVFWLRSKLRSPGVKIPKFSKTVFGR